MTRRQRLRKEIINIWEDTTGSTATRSTKYNDLCNEYQVTEAYAASLFVKARADIIA